MNIDDDQVDAAASELLEAVAGAQSVQLFTARFQPFTFADARAIARRTDHLRTQRGETRIGYKLGWTSEAMRKALGVDRPNWGTLWDTQVATKGQSDARFRIEVPRQRPAKIEPELVWRCPVDLAGASRVNELESLDGSWALGLEVVQPRFGTFGFDWLDNTADNSSAAAVVVGPFVSVEPDAIVEANLDFSDGEITASGTGRAVMGSPFAAIAWLTESLADEGTSLVAGDIIFTGGLTAPLDVRPGRSYNFVAPWGSVSAVAPD